MDEESGYASASLPPRNGGGGGSGGISSNTGHRRRRRRAITSCFTCRRRKVKCDREHPTCSACRTANRVCDYEEPGGGGGGGERGCSRRSSADYGSPASPSDRPRKVAGGSQMSLTEINQRLERLESLLERTLQNSVATPQTLPQDDAVQESVEAPASEKSTPATRSVSSEEPIHAVDGYDGTLLVENGQSQFVSSLHWSLLATQLQDIKTMLSTDHVPSKPVPSAFCMSEVTQLMPASADECYELLDVFYRNVDPLTRLIYKPSLDARFRSFVNHHTSAFSSPEESSDDHSAHSSLETFRPLAFSVFYSAVNSLQPQAVATRFGADKPHLLDKYQKGLELSLVQADFCNTSSIEVLQAFVLLLTCQARDTNMSRTWPLMGVAIRVAMSQGLHREPTLFVPSLDEVGTELRRRIWHQLCYLDWRASEGKGMEPYIVDNEFTTLVPRNVDDEDLREGRAPPHYPLGVAGVMAGGGVVGGVGLREEERFTGMTVQVCRHRMSKCLRRITQNMYNLARRSRSAMLVNGGQGGGSGGAAAGGAGGAGAGARGDAVTASRIREFEALFQDTKRTIDDAHAGNEKLYTRHAFPGSTEQRLAIFISKAMEWKCWLVFWCGLPKDVRREVMSDDMRAAVLNQSIALVEALADFCRDPCFEHWAWHIESHSGFQSIMLIISELRDPAGFPAARDRGVRSRALRALRKSYSLEGHADSKTWAVISGYIEQLDTGETNGATPSTSGFTPTVGGGGFLSPPLPGMHAAGSHQQRHVAETPRTSATFISPTPNGSMLERMPTSQPISAGMQHTRSPSWTEWMSQELVDMGLGPLGFGPSRTW